MKLVVSAFIIFTVAASGDTIYLRNGETVQGTYLGGTAREIRMDTGTGGVRTLDVGRVQSISFGDPNYSPDTQPPPASPVADPGYQRDRNGYTAQNQPPAPGPMGVTVPPDTNVTVRMMDSVNSETARRGQTFRASLDEPIFVNGQMVIPRGADVLTKLVDEEQSGKIEGRAVLKLALVSISVNGQPIPVTSSDVRTESSSRGERSAGVIGGGTALGAIVGALAGGGKGAAIGAASGATLGTGAEVLTKGQTVKIPSETRLTFRLQTPMQL